MVAPFTSSCVPVLPRSPTIGRHFRDVVHQQPSSFSIHQRKWIMLHSAVIFFFVHFRALPQGVRGILYTQLQNKVHACLVMLLPPAALPPPPPPSSTPPSPYFLFLLGVLGPEEQKVTGVHTTCCSPLRPPSRSSSFPYFRVFRRASAPPSCFPIRPYVVLKSPSTHPPPRTFKPPFCPPRRVI